MERVDLMSSSEMESASCFAGVVKSHALVETVVPEYGANRRQDGVRVIECKILGPWAIKVYRRGTVRITPVFTWFLKCINFVSVGRHSCRRHLLR